MSGIKIIKFSNINDILNKYPINKLVFWIGAGIDFNSPTSLPLGYGLTDMILKLACREENYNLFLDVWGEISNLISSETNNDVVIPERPRLETIIEAVREFEEHQQKKESIIKGLETFSSVYFKFNHEHYVLAYLLNKGANIVTTNYGDFICDAYKSQFGNTIHHCCDDDLHVYKTQNQWGSSIFHIHGISSDLKTIGANLSNVKNKFPISFVNKFDEWINNGYCFIFLGYSGLDSLDVNPFFKSRTGNSSTGLYIKHTQNLDISTISISKNEGILLHPFSEKCICPCVTGDFLCCFGKFHDSINNNSKSNWEKIFIKHSTPFSLEKANTFLLGLCYRLGISIKPFLPKENWTNLINPDSVDDWYENYYTFQNSAMLGDNKVMVDKGEYLKSLNDNLAELDYFFYIGNIEMANKKMHSVSDLYSQLNDCLCSNVTIDWNISTQLNHHVEFLAYKALETDSVFHFIETIKKEIQNGNLSKLQSCFELIISGGYDAVLEVNQINTAYRALALCQAFDNQSRKAQKNLKIALENYADISSINGITTVELYTALVHVIEYCYSNKVSYLKMAKNKLELSNKLISELGLFKYKRIYTYICNFYNKIYNSLDD